MSARVDAGTRRPRSGNLPSGTTEALAASWGITKYALRVAKTKAARLGFPGDRRIEFLCAKRVAPGSADIQHPNGTVTYHSRFNLIIDPAKAGKHQAEWQQRQDIIHGILGMKTSQALQPVDADTIPPEHSFDTFVSKHPTWGLPTSFVVFRDHPQLAGKNSLIQRVQTHGPCAIHAPVVWQHYLVAMQNAKPVATVDIAVWIRKSAENRMVDELVMDRGPAAFFDVATAIFIPQSHFDIVNGVADVTAALMKNGPLLIDSLENPRVFPIGLGSACWPRHEL